MRIAKKFSVWIRRCSRHPFVGSNSRRLRTIRENPADHGAIRDRSTRVSIRYVTVTGAQRSVDSICMNQQGSQRRAPAPSRPRVVRRTDDGNAWWSRFSGVLAESFASAEPTGDVRDAVGPPAEGCRAACTARSLQLQQHTPPSPRRASMWAKSSCSASSLEGRTERGYRRVRPVIGVTGVKSSADRARRSRFGCV